MYFHWNHFYVDIYLDKLFFCCSWYTCFTLLMSANGRIYIWHLLYRKYSNKLEIVYWCTRKYSNLEFGYFRSPSLNNTSTVQKTSTPSKKSPVLSKKSPVLSLPLEILDPCLPVGMITEGGRDDVYRFKGTGDYHACQESLLPLLNLTLSCQTSPCSFNGVHQPEINFHNSEFYGFAEFWYTMEDVYRIGGQYEYDIFAAQAKVRFWKFFIDTLLRRLTKRKLCLSFLKGDCVQKRLWFANVWSPNTKLLFLEMNFTLF